MKEESRIEALEHELKILKNEIQSTLLEIREQVLNHYYPELRAEEPLHNHSLPVRPSVGRPGLPMAVTSRQEEPVTLSEIAAKGQIQPFSDIFLEDLDEELDDDKALVNSRRPDTRFDDLDDLDDLDELDEQEDAEQPSSVAVRELKVQQVVSGPKNPGVATPKTREVDFRQLKQGRAATGTAAPTAVQAPRRAAAVPGVAEASPAATSSLPNMTALTQWVNEGVESVGKERVLEVIDTYTTGGKLSGAARSALHKIVSRTEENERETPVGSREMLALMVALDQILDQ